MESLNFEIGTRETSSPERRLFDKCVEVAAIGRDTEFNFAINEPVTVPFVPADGSRPRLVTRTLSFEVNIDVFGSQPDGRMLMTEHRREDEGDTRTVRTSLWAREAAYAGTGIEFGRDIDPHSAIRDICVGWAERMVSARLADPEKARRFSFDGITDAIREQIAGMAVFVDGDGLPALARRTEIVPRLALVEDPVMGGKHFYGLVFDRERHRNWKTELCSFPVGDIETARNVRDTLVSTHCPDHDPDFGYDWADTVLSRQEPGYARVDRSEALLALDGPERILLRGVRALAEAMGAAGLMSLENRADVEEIVSEGGSVDELLAVVRVAADADSERYAAFLSNAGWNFPFDPVEIAAARIAAMIGLDHAAGETVAPKSPMPRF